MFKLPTCPYCDTVYDYREVRKSTGQKLIKCYNCKREFSVAYIKQRIIFYTILSSVMVLIDLFIISCFHIKGFLSVFIFNVIVVGLSLLLLPYLVRFKPKVKNKK